MKPWPQTSPMTAPKSRPFSRASARCSKNTEKREHAMKHSVDKILTTHAGSLPRPEDWLQMMMEREKGTEEEYLYAIADAMHVEYQAIVDAGFLLQIDDPRFATYYAMSEVTLDECRKWAEKRVAALNH